MKLPCAVAESSAANGETAEAKNKNWTPENYPILRYADVLLMLAEAENEVNKQPHRLGLYSPKSCTQTCRHPRSEKPLL